MSEQKNPYEAFRQQNARIALSATKEIDDPDNVIQQEQVDRNRVIPTTPGDEAQGQPS